MLDHVGFAVSDAEASRRFYEVALAPLGVTLIMTVPAEENGSGGTAHGFGVENNPFFWVGDNERVGGGDTCRLHRRHARGRRCLPCRRAGSGRQGSRITGTPPAIRS